MFDASGKGGFSGFRSWGSQLFLFGLDWFDWLSGHLRNPLISTGCASRWSTMQRSRSLGTLRHFHAASISWIMSWVESQLDLKTFGKSQYFRTKVWKRNEGGLKFQPTTSGKCCRGSKAQIVNWELLNQLHDVGAKQSTSCKSATSAWLVATKALLCWILRQLPITGNRKTYNLLAHQVQNCQRSPN